MQEAETSKSSYSAITKKNLSNDVNEEKGLEIKIRDLCEATPSHYTDLRKKVEDIAEKYHRIVINYDKDRREKESEIRQLKVRVSNLERQVEKLKRIDTIDAAEAMKIFGIHVASFVLPPNEEIASVGAFDQMLEYAEEAGNTRWHLLLTQCFEVWTSNHLDTKNKFITYRNIEAHQKKFDLAQLRTAMKKLMPHRKQECEDLLYLFEKVDSLLKFGMLAKESVVSGVIKSKLLDPGKLDKIVRECYRTVEHLQDIEIETAKKHLIQYFPHIDCNTIISVIINTNRPRLDKLVKDTELQIVSWILQNPAILTLDQMDKYLARDKRSSVEQAEQWNMLTDGKKWSENHSKAITELKKLLPDNQSGVDPLPLYIAKLHVADFLEKGLWDAGSDILEIFDRWEKS